MVLRFGPFELDADREELRRSGLVLRLPHQPARLLLLFVRRAGAVVTREEIQQEIWGNDTHVDFEQGINAAIRQIRFHLGDNAEAPRYLKTIPRRGYVWIAPVEEVARSSSAFSRSSEATAEPPRVPSAEEPKGAGEPKGVEEPKRSEAPRNRPGKRIAIAAVAAVLLIGAALAAWFVYPRNRRTIAIRQYRAIGALPPGVDVRAFTQELRSTVGMLPRKHVLLLDEPSNDAQVRIEGTIQLAGGSLRVIVSGVDTASRTQLWTEMYERRLGEHHNMAMQTAHLVAREVARRFLPPPRHEPLLRTDVPPNVLEIYRRARLERRRSLPDPAGNRAAALFEQALAAEPRFAEALSGLADVWVQRAGTSGPPRRMQAVAKARDYATRALALQPDNPEARSALGLVALQFDWDLSAAEQAFRQAVEDDPEYVDGHYNLCAALAARGESDAALEEYERLRELDPIDFNLHPVEGMLYIRARRYEEAIAKYREILRFRESAQSRWGILWAAGKLGDWEEATSVLRPMLDLPPRPRGQAATREEYVDLFRRIEPILLAARERGTFDDYHVAGYYSMRGDRDLAFAALERAVASRSPGIGFVMIDPRFDALRNDPRYAKFTAHIR